VEYKVNLDYKELMRPSNVAIKNDFIATCKQGIADMLGASVTANHVLITLSEGSVKVHAEIIVPDGQTTEGIQSTLAESDFTTLQNKMSQVDGINTLVSSGNTLSFIGTVSMNGNAFSPEPTLVWKPEPTPAPTPAPELAPLPTPAPTFAPSSSTLPNMGLSSTPQPTTLIQGVIKMIVDNPAALVGNPNAHNCIRTGMVRATHINSAPIELLNIQRVSSRRLTKGRRLAGVVRVDYRITVPIGSWITSDTVPRASNALVREFNVCLKSVGAEVYSVYDPNGPTPDVSDSDSKLEQSDSAAGFCWGSLFATYVLAVGVCCLGRG